MSGFTDRFAPLGPWVEPSNPQHNCVPKAPRHLHPRAGGVGVSETDILPHPTGLPMPWAPCPHPDRASTLNEAPVSQGHTQPCTAAVALGVDKLEP